MNPLSSEQIAGLITLFLASLLFPAVLDYLRVRRETRDRQAKWDESTSTVMRNIVDSAQDVISMRDKELVDQRKLATDRLLALNYLIAVVKEKFPLEAAHAESIANGGSV